MAEKRPSISKSATFRRKASPSLNVKPHLCAGNTFSKARDDDGKGKVRKYRSAPGRFNRSTLARRVSKTGSKVRKISCALVKEPLNLDEPFIKMPPDTSKNKNGVCKLELNKMSPSTSADFAMNVTDNSTSAERGDLENTNYEFNLKQFATQVKKEEALLSINSQVLNKDARQSIISGRIGGDASETNTSKCTPLFNIEKQLKLPETLNNRPKFETQRQKSTPVSLLLTKNAAAKIKVGQDNVAERHHYHHRHHSCPVSFRKPSSPAISNEYIEDVRMLAEFVRKATLDFFKDAEAVKAALEQRIAMKKADNQTDKPTTPCQRLSSTSSVRHRPKHMIRSRNHKSSAGSSTSDLYFQQVTSRTNANNRLIGSDKTDQTSWMNKKRNVVSDKSVQETQIKTRKLMTHLLSDAVLLDNLRVCTSFNLERDSHNTLIKQKQSKIDKAVTESVQNSLTSIDDLTGLGAIIAESRRTSLEQQYGSKLRKHCKGPSVPSHSVSSKQGSCNMSISSQSSRRIANGYDADTDHSSRTTRPQNTNVFEAISKPADRISIASEYSKLSNKTTQTECASGTRLSHFACSKAVRSGWEDKSSQSIRSTEVKSNFEAAPSLVSKTCKNRTSLTTQDLPTYLEPPDAWAFYNRTSIRLPYMEIDGIFDGTSFAAGRKKTNLKNFDCKAVQVNMQQPTEWIEEDSSVKSVAIKDLAKFTDPVLPEQLNSSEFSQDITDNEEVIDPKGCFSPKSVAETPKVTVVNDRNTSLQEKIGITTDDDDDEEQKTKAKKIPSKSSRLTHRSLRFPTKANRMLHNQGLNGYEIQHPIAKKKLRTPERQWVTKCATGNRRSLLKSNPENYLPGYARPTSTSCRRYLETQMAIKKRKQLERLPSKCMATAQKKAEPCMDKHKKALSSRRRSSILVMQPRSYSLNFESCPCKTTGSSETESLTKSHSSVQDCCNSKKLISFCLHRNKHLKDPGSVDEELLPTDVGSISKKYEKEEMHPSEASTSGCHANQGSQKNMPFFKKWLKSVSQVLYPWKNIIMKPNAVSVSCSNTNLICLPNLLMQNKLAQKKSSRVKPRVLGAKANIH